MNGNSISPPNTLIDQEVSHYFYVTQRIAALNPTRLFGGIVAARDWPLQKAQDQTFYMVSGNGKSSRSVNSWQAQIYTYGVRWAWLIIGTDIPAGTEMSNRGDRFAIHKKMQTELLNGLFPGFCSKQQYTVIDNGSGVAQLVATPFQGSERVWWSPPDWSERQDSQNGVQFGYGATAVSAFSPEINS